MNKLLALTLPWRENLQNTVFKIELILTLIAWLGVVAIHPFVLEIVEFRSLRIPLNDWVLNVLPCANLSTYIFILLYSSVLIGIFSCISKPRLLLMGFQTYMLVQLFRMITLLVFPLDTPLNLEILRDPLVEATFYKGNVYTRDLFFSGHVATMATFYYLEDRPWLKKYFFVALIAMSLMILIQHVHYTIDVIGAWIFAYLCHHAVRNNKDLINFALQKLIKQWKP